MMSQIVVTLYDSFATAESVVEELTSGRKLKSEDVSLLTYEDRGGDASQDDESATFLARLLGSGRDIGDVRDALIKLGVTDSDAQHFAEGLRRGNTLVAVRCDEAKVQEIYPVLQRYEPIDITERATQGREESWTGFQPEAKPFTAAEAAVERKPYAQPVRPGKAGKEEVLPVVEEKLVVGKHEVEHGGVRVYSRVVETPVEETVTLREEHVHVEHRPVDRPVEASELNAFKEGAIEMTEKAEEAVVTKQARVIEEVIISKDTEQRTEAIRDTVRRTDVQVEDTRHGERPDYAADENEFQTHYNTQFANSGYTYKQFLPAYRFGRTLRTHERYRNADWNTIEPNARRIWEERNPGTWHEFSHAIRYAWERGSRNERKTGLA